MTSPPHSTPAHSPTPGQPSTTPGAEPAEAAFDIVVIGASAGGLVAAMTLLRALPRDFPVPLVLMLHLAPESDATGFYARLPFEVEWIRAGSVLERRKLLICPPRAIVEVLPNGTCAVSPTENGAMAKPIDRLFASVARSFGNRAIGVILSGMGNDGAAGVRELHAAGGRIVVQSEATADHPQMPKAAIESGTALVVPLHDIGQVVDELVAGIPRPRAQTELDAIRRVFGAKGTVATAARGLDWSRTPLGAVLRWPEELRLLVRTALESPYAVAIWWGAELAQVYNDAWRDFLGATRHPQALGAPARDTWVEIWHEVGPMVERVMQGEAVGGEDYPMLIDRHGFLEEIYLTFSYSPIRDASGAVVGVHNTGWETTRNVVAERRMRALRALATGAAGAKTPREACERAAATLAAHPQDFPFALIYLPDASRRQALLAGAAGVEPGSAIAPRLVSVAADDGAGWPLARALTAGALTDSDGFEVDDLPARFAGLAPPASSLAGTLPPKSALMLPLRPATDRRAAGVLIAALSPHRPFDEGYRTFLALVVRQINAAIGEARVRQVEHERLERLAELDRTKTEFFANVSHEFRTPLTLLLAPLEDLLREREQLRPQAARELEVAARNARRLLRLVNSLLDFSEIESRHRLARLEPADLPAMTGEIVSAFRSAIEAAGLQLRVELDADLPAVPVNREMWEKILSNLLANAFKFTFEGTITVRLRALRLHAELTVADTGIGIAEAELPQLFKRFHRVRGAKARSAEGSGIGLAIVRDLVSRMGGQIDVRSIEGRGTTFTIWLPFKSRLAAPAQDGPAGADSKPLAADLATEVASWLTASDPPAEVIDDVLGPPFQEAAESQPQASGGRLLIVDDNADMREYLRRLLEARWEVQLAAGGVEALERARREAPDVVLADVMMPGMSGYDLLQQLRADPRLARTPVILLTARASERAAIAGLRAGADDYVAKPFSPRELVARIQAAMDRARAESALRESEERYRARNEELERFARLTVGRELRMIELKEEVNALRARVGDAARYALGFVDLEEGGTPDAAPPPALPLAGPEDATTQLRDARRATLNVLEDAVESRDRAERLNRDLRIGEERLQRMVNVGGIGILTFEAASGTLVDANDAFLGMSGYTRDQVTSRQLTWRSMTPDEYVAASEEQMRQLQATGRIGPYEKEYLHADGSRSWMLFAGASIGDGTVVEYCINIDAQKLAEAALREREAWLAGQGRAREAALPGEPLAR